VRDEMFDEFYARDYARLVAAIAIAIGDHDIARDAVDEALARALERGRRDTIEQLAPWVRVVALNVARSQFRRRAAERRANERLMARALAPENADASVALDVARAMSKLSRRQREVMVLHYFLDLPVREIARDLRLAEGTVKAFLHRGRAMLAAELEDLGVGRD
jgi:RNA polymerase sigma-70 factor, ECF subfamily